MTQPLAWIPTPLSDFLSTHFDYIIVGGGTAGLTLAARLSEDPDVQVGVIEAGESKHGDPNVDSPARLTHTLHNPDYDWVYHSVPQAGTNGSSHHVARGKLLGGSSAINFMAYCRPAAEDIDLWAKLGNPGWSWNELMPYYIKSQNFSPMRGQETARHEGFCDSSEHSHGFTGPIITTFPKGREGLEDSIIDAFDEASGVPRPENPWGGRPLGIFGHLSTIDREHDSIRSYAASAYLHPNGHRQNLKVLTEAMTCRVLIDRASKTAEGVEFMCEKNLCQARAKTDIILSAGSIGSPQLLELSGIGDPELLQAVGIDCILPLADVGNNLREHPLTSLTYALNHNQEDTRGGQDPESVESDLAGGVSLMAFLPYGRVVSPSEVLEAVSKSMRRHQFCQEEQEDIISRLQSPILGAFQFNGAPAMVDIAAGHSNQSKLQPGLEDPDTRYYSFLVTLTQAFSRGTTHISSADPFAAPDIDLGLLKDPADVDLLAAGLNFADKIFSSRHIKDEVKQRVFPSPTVDLTDRDQARKYVRGWTTSFNHTLGSCAMGHVVDERLKVKGIQNLRVVDASVMPTQTSGNIIATVYAVAEKAADLIKEDRAPVIRS